MNERNKKNSSKNFKTPQKKHEEKRKENFK